MPGVVRWIEVLASRKKWLDRVMVSADPTLPFSYDRQPYMEDPQFAFLHAAQTVVTIQLVRSDGGVDYNGIEAIAQDDRFSGTMVEIIYVHHHWYGNGFKTCPNLENMSKDLEAFMRIRVSVIGLDNFTEKMLMQKEKAPIEKVCDLMPLSAFLHLEYAAGVCSSEHEIKVVVFP